MRAEGGHCWGPVLQCLGRKRPWIVGELARGRSENRGVVGIFLKDLEGKKRVREINRKITYNRRQISLSVLWLLVRLSNWAGFLMSFYEKGLLSFLV
jgi:hypothetical protein